MSLPAWECGLKFADVLDGYNRTHEECGLKSMPTTTIAPMMGHSPHGECGLKWADDPKKSQRRVTPRMGSAG